MNKPLDIEAERARYVAYRSKGYEPNIPKGLALRNDNRSFQVSSIEQDFQTWLAAKRDTDSQAAPFQPDWVNYRQGVADGKAELLAALGVLTDGQMEADWEARKLELKQKYPGIAGQYKVFEVLITTETGCKVEDGEYSIAITGMLGAWMERDDWDHIADAVAEEVGDMALPEEGQTAIIVYESGEREDVFWNKFYRIAAIQSALTQSGKPQQGGDA